MIVEEFRQLVVDYLTQIMPAKTSQIANLKNDDDLIGSGLVDSHIFVEMCLLIEEKTGAIIDLGELEPEQFSSVNGLFAVVCSQNA